MVGLVKKGNFDRIVLDTAPTGHTLRMLSTPAFISELIEKVLAIAQKVNSNPMVKVRNDVVGDWMYRRFISFGNDWFVCIEENVSPKQCIYICK